MYQSDLDLHCPGLSVRKLRTIEVLYVTISHRNHEKHLQLTNVKDALIEENYCALKNIFSIHLKLLWRPCGHVKYNNLHFRKLLWVENSLIWSQTIKWTHLKSHERKFYSFKMKIGCFYLFSRITSSTCIIMHSHDFLHSKCFHWKGLETCHKLKVLKHLFFEIRYAFSVQCCSDHSQSKQNT